jgi:hypothetical protein
MRAADIARICHEANAALCQAFGDNSQVAWDQAPQWQRDSAIAGVEFHVLNPDASPAASHNNWYEHKAADGWRYGAVKDAELREHPCMVAFEQLPPEQRAKDFIFRAIVHAARYAPADER